MAKSNYCLLELHAIERKILILGLWPTKQPSFWHKIRGVLSMFVLVVLWSGMTMQCMIDIKHTDYLAIEIAGSLATLNCIAKYSILIFNRKRLLKALEYIQNPLFSSYSDDMEIQILEKMRITKLLFVIALCSTSVIVIMTLSIPFVFPDRALPVACSLDMNQVPLAVYLFFCLYQIIGAAVLAYALPCVDLLILYLMLIVIGQLQILCERLHYLSDCRDLNRDHALEINIQHHVLIERFVWGFEDTFTYAVLIQLILSMILTCFLCFSFLLMKYLNHSHLCVQYVSRLIKLTGLWPENEPTLWYFLRGKMSILIFVTFGALMLIQGLHDIQQPDYIFFDVAVFLATANCIIKYFVLIANRNRLCRTLEQLKDPFFEARSDYMDRQIFSKMRACKIVLSMYLLCTLLLVAMSLIIPIVVLKNSGRTLPLPWSIDMNKQPLLVYILLFVFQTVGGVLISFSLPCLDALILFLMMAAFAQLENLYERISYLGDDYELEDQCRDRLMKHVLYKSVEHHVSIERFVQGFEGTFTYAMLGQLFFSVTLACFTGFNFIVVPLFSLQFGRAFFFFLAVMLELAMFCIPGNEIIRQSAKIRDACYSSQWIDASPSVRKSLFIIMERSKRPFSLTAGKFVDLSLPTFLTVLRSAFSYFTVLWQLYRDSDKIQ